MSLPRRCSVLLLLTALLGTAVAVASGLLSLVTTFGTSMSPRIVADDLLVVRASSYGIGDVVAYRSPELRQVVVHRIVARDGERFVFQGDHNLHLDAERLPASAVVGKELLHVPGGGTWLRRLTSPPALAAVTFLLLAGGTAATTHRRRRRHKERRTVTPSPRTSLGSLQPLAATAGVLGLVGALLGGIAWTRPVAATAAAPAHLDFSYSAAVPLSAAYDGRTVRAPQPVFRALTDEVAVHYAYAGPPGSIALDVELSDGSGWRSTVPVRPESPLAAAQEGVVQLDLSALEDRAHAAAAATGIASGSTTVTVVARVRTEGGEFAPELPLALDAQALRLTDAAALSATSPSAGSSVASARLDLLGRSIGVQSARVLSGTLLLGALLLGLVTAAAARRGGPVSEAERLRRRHRDLLLPVLPVALAPGRPVVDVPTVAALLTLAQRYGLLVLHWERGGVTTYVVQDEGTTYRFRESVPSWTAAPSAGRAASSEECARQDSNLQPLDP